MSGYEQAYSTRLYRLGALRFPDAAGLLPRATESDVAPCVDLTEAGAAVRVVIAGYGSDNPFEGFGLGAGAFGGAGAVGFVQFGE